jgi:hypothetical protein
MADPHQFAKRSGTEELWNVTLLPLPAAWRARTETKSLEKSGREAQTGPSVDQIVTSKRRLRVS